MRPSHLNLKLYSSVFLKKVTIMMIHVSFFYNLRKGPYTGTDNRFPIVEYIR